MAQAEFVHLHVHSHYSLLDGATRIKDLVRCAKEDGQTALALTDHGNLFGAIDFYQAAKAEGIKPIIGCEAYIAGKSRLEKLDRADNPTYHLTLLAKDWEGYKNLVKLASLAYVEGFHVRPRMDKEILAKYSKGLMALSGCLSGELNQKLLTNNMPGAKRSLDDMAGIFGKENFYLEVMRNGLERQEDVNQQIFKLAKQTGLSLVATNDIHYLHKEDVSAQEIKLCITTGKKLSDERRMRMESNAFYFRSAAEMAQLFVDHPQALRTTLEIAEKSHVAIELGKHRLPVFDTGCEKTPEELFAELCAKGFARRYPQPPAGARERLHQETAVIKSMGFVSYFLIVWDFIRFAKENKIPVGPGRGSAAGSIVAYCLGITDIEPLRYDLLFERFLNSERISMPDIDIDFCRDGREKVIQYVREKYGWSNVSQIVTFGTMAAKLVLRDVGRVLGIPLREVDQIAKKIPIGPNVELKKSIDEDKELQALRDSDARYQELFAEALKLEGLARHASTHAAGVVISDRPLDEIVPLYRDPARQKNNGNAASDTHSLYQDLSTQYDMNAVEAVGLLKMDFLGLKTLTILDKTVALIKAHRGIDVDLANLDYQDAKTFALLTAGDSFGVFQLESEGMRKLLQRLKPDCFEDLIALLSLYRPGPLGSGMVDSFVRRKHKEEKIVYPHPLLEEILKETYGVIVYQEQVMRIAAKLAGFSLNQADSLRKAMGKKKPEIMQKFRQEFIDGAKQNQVQERTAAEIWDLMEYFAGYGFNKSHSTAYAVITYQTAYLKANYCLEFLCANLSCEISDSDKVRAFVEEAKKHKIAVLAPDLLHSSADFTVSEQAIRYGLIGIKGVGARAVEEVIKARKRIGTFRSLHHFGEEVDLQAVNKSAVEAFVKSGAFGFLKQEAAQLLASIESAMSAGSRLQEDRRCGQKNLFAVAFTAETEPPAIKLPDVPPWQEAERLTAEKEALGFYLTGHPLMDKSHLVQALSNVSSANLHERRDGDEVLFAGLITQLKTVTVKQGRYAGEKMARLRLEDLQGSAPCIAFPETFQRFKLQIVDDTLVVARGHVDLSGEEAGLRIAEIYTFDQALQSLQGGVIIPLQEYDKIILPSLVKLLERFPGQQPVYFDIQAQETHSRVRAGNQYRVALSEKLEQAVKELLGEGRFRPIGPLRLADLPTKKWAIQKNPSQVVIEKAP